MIRLVCELAGSRSGLTLEEMRQKFDPPLERRTVERMRDRIAVLFQDWIRSEFVDGEKHWRLDGPPLPSVLLATDATELAALDIAAKRLSRDGRTDHADALRSLGGKVRAATDARRRASIEPDHEALLAAEGFVLRPGPKARTNEQVMAHLRGAILGSRKVRLTYRRRGDGEMTTPKVNPLGILTGRRHYLVAFSRPAGKELLFALTEIQQVDVLDESFDPPRNWKGLQHFAENAFGVWQEEPVDVVWTFSKKAASGAKGFEFHPRQKQEPLPDGRLRVSFRAGGLLEMAWHLFTWGDDVTIESPKRLRTMLAELLKKSLAKHAR